MSYKRRSINLAFGNQTKNLFTIASIHTARLKRKVLAIHVGQGKNLRTVIEGHYGNNRVRTSTLPCQSEGVIGTCHFNNHICPAMCAIRLNIRLTLFRRNNLNLRIMHTQEASSLSRLFAYNDTLRMLQTSTKQGTDARRTCAYDKYRIFWLYFRNARRPKARSQNVAHEQGLLIGYSFRNTIQPLIGMGHTDIFSLSSIDATTQCPSSIRVFTIVHIAMLAKKAFATEGFDINRHPIARLNAMHIRPYLLDYSYHLVPDGNAWHGTRHTSMFDMQIAGTDAPKRDAHQGVMRIFQRGYWFL